MFARFPAPNTPHNTVNPSRQGCATSVIFTLLRFPRKDFVWRGRRGPFFCVLYSFFLPFVSTSDCFLGTLRVCWLVVSLSLRKKTFQVSPLPFHSEIQPVSRFVSSLSCCSFLLFSGFLAPLSILYSIHSPRAALREVLPNTVTEQRSKQLGEERACISPDWQRTSKARFPIRLFTPFFQKRWRRSPP